MRLKGNNSRIARMLRDLEAKLIYEVFVDRHHQTNVAIPILHPSYMLTCLLPPSSNEIFKDPEVAENVIAVESGPQSTSTANP